MGASSGRPHTAQEKASSNRNSVKAQVESLTRVRERVRTLLDEIRTFWTLKGGKSKRWLDCGYKGRG